MQLGTMVKDLPFTVTFITGLCSRMYNVLSTLLVQEEFEQNFVQFFQTLGISSSAVNCQAWTAEAYLLLTCYRKINRKFRYRG